MRICEPGTLDGTVVRHRSVRLPLFMHTITARIYSEEEWSIPRLCPVTGEISPPCGSHVIRVPPLNEILREMETVRDAVIYMPLIPEEERVYGRLERCAEALLSRGNAIIVHLPDHQLPPVPAGVTAIVSLLPALFGLTEPSELLQAASVLGVDPPPALLLPILPGLSDGPDADRWLDLCGDRLPGSPVIGLVPKLDKGTLSLLFDRIDHGGGNATRACRNPGPLSRRPTGPGT